MSNQKIQEFLNELFLIEVIDSEIKKVKSFGKELSKDLNTFDIIKIARYRQRINNIDEDKLQQYVYKKFPKQKRKAEQKLKLKDFNPLTKLVEIYYICLLYLKEKGKLKKYEDSSLHKKVDGKLFTLEKYIKKLEPYIKKDQKIPTKLIASLIKDLIALTFFMSTIMFVEKEIAVICLVISFLLIVDMFIIAKRSNKQVI